VTEPSLAEDEAAPVREGEGLDLVRLEAYLAREAPAISGTISAKQFPSGFSNLTYLLTIGDREVVLRRPPVGVKRGTAHDMGREYRILRALSAAGVAVPRPMLNCEDDSILGVPFYLMERVKGVILRRGNKSAALTPDTMHALSDSFVDTMIAIHAVPTETLDGVGKPDGYVMRQVQGWTSRYQRARTDDVPDFDKLARWLDDNRPAESGATLVHNDYKYDNVVLDPADLGRIRAVLDWEMATIGDPLMDLGTTLGYWVEASDPPMLRTLGLGITALPGNFTRRELAEQYAERSGRPLERFEFYHAFGLFKIAVIAQQIYARYRAGVTKDERFAPLGDVVKALAGAGLAAIR
jgi:aminoglycoside phosphotransferase (APT) family kinase protein